MKIVFVIPEYRVNTNDHFYHLYQLIEKLAEVYEVALIAEAGDKTCNIKNLKKYKVQSIKQPQIFRVFQRFFWFIDFRMKGYKNFYCHYCELSTLQLKLVSQIFPLKVFKWHCSQQHLYKTPWTLRNFYKKILDELPVNLSIQKSDVLVTCSPQMKDYFHHFYKRNLKSIAILPNFICLKDMKETNKFVNPKKIKMLFVHRLSPRKGADRLISYAKAIKNKKYPIGLTVIGDGPLYEEIKVSINKLYLRNIIKLLGKVPHSNLSDFYKSADFLLMPSRDEEFGRVQIEAMKYGIPILSTKTLSSEFVLSDFQKKFVVEQKNYLKLLEKSILLAQNSKEYNQLIKEGYIQVKNFSLKKAVLRSSKILKKYGRS